MMFKARKKLKTSKFEILCPSGSSFLWGSIFGVSYRVIVPRLSSTRLVRNRRPCICPLKRRGPESLPVITFLWILRSVL